MSQYFALFFSKKNSNCLRKLRIEVGCMCGRVHPIKPQRSPSVFHVLASSHLSMPTAETARNFLRYHTDITFEAHNQLGSLVNAAFCSPSVYLQFFEFCSIFLIFIPRVTVQRSAQICTGRKKGSTRRRGACERTPTK